MGKMAGSSSSGTTSRLGAPAKPRFGYVSTPRLAPYTAANRFGGTWEGQTSVLALSVGDSRLIAGFSLALSPIAKLFGTFEPFGAQLVGTPNSGKTSAAMAIGATWGCNFRGGRPSPKGYVNSWNITPAKAEDPAAARNCGLLILEETRNAVKTNGSRAQTIFDITMLIAEGSEKDRKTNTDVHLGIGRQRFSRPAISRWISWLPRTALRSMTRIAAV